MKHRTRMIAGFLAALTSAGFSGSSLCAYAEDEPAQAHLLGDFNNDGAVDVTDAQMVLQAYTDQLAGLTPSLEDWQLAAADVDISTTLDVTDAQFILNYYVANTVIGTETTWEDIRSAALSAAEQAMKITEKFMEAYLAEDWQTVIDLSDTKALVTLIKGKIPTDEEMLANFSEEKSGSAEKITDETIISRKLLAYQIGAEKEEPELMEKCNKYLEELRKSAKESMEAQGEDSMTEEELAAMEFILPYLEPVTDLYSFEVTATVQTIETEYDSEGNAVSTPMEETETDTLYVFRSGGRWVFDIGVIPLGITLMESRARSELRSAARTVRNAYNTALTDLDMRGVDVSMYGGTHILTSDYYQNLTDAETDPGAQLRYLVAQYYPEITKCKEIAVYIENGCCVCTAVSLEQDGVLKYAIYPIVDDGNGNNFASINEAIETEKRLYQAEYGD